MLFSQRSAMQAALGAIFRRQDLISHCEHVSSRADGTVSVHNDNTWVALVSRISRDEWWCLDRSRSALAGFPSSITSRRPNRSALSRSNRQDDLEWQCFSSAFRSAGRWRWYRSMSCLLSSRYALTRHWVDVHRVQTESGNHRWGRLRLARSLLARSWMPFHIRRPSLDGILFLNWKKCRKLKSI